jgi:hypothetical protein
LAFKGISRIPQQAVRFSEVNLKASPFRWVDNRRVEGLGRGYLRGGCPALCPALAVVLKQHQGLALSPQ